MDGAALAGGIGTTRELRGIVHRARFVVTADGNRSTGPKQQRSNRRSRAGLRGVGRIGTEQRAGDAEIEDNAVPFPKICGDDRGRRLRIFRKPAMNLVGVRDGGKAASGAKSVVSESRIDSGETLESLPGGRFGDGDVGIIGD